MEKYLNFLKSKILSTPKAGFHFEEKDLHESNLPHQKEIIKQA